MEVKTLQVNGWELTVVKDKYSKEDSFYNSETKTINLNGVEGEDINILIHELTHFYYDTLYVSAISHVNMNYPELFKQGDTGAITSEIFAHINQYTWKETNKIIKELGYYET